MPDWVVAADIGERIERLRRLYGETQKSFAKRLRRSWKRLSAWENGKTPPRDVLEEAWRPSQMGGGDRRVYGSSSCEEAFTT
jgi:DNA-binding XRE family transcriptional regulator